MAFFSPMGLVRRMFSSQVSVPVAKAGAQATASRQNSMTLDKLEGRALFASSAAAFSVIADPNTPIGPIYVAPAKVAAKAPIKAAAKAKTAPMAALATTSSTPKVTAGFYDGINVTGGADASSVIPKLRELGISGVRIWVGMNTWSHRGNGQAFLQAKMYKDAGFKVMMNVGVVDTSSESNYQGFFNWLKSRQYFKSVDMIQVGNEPNHYKSWKGGIDGYMKLLKIAYNTLHPTGMKVLGAGPTYDVEACKELVRQGYLNYVDYAGFHPYGNSAEQVISRLKGAREAYGNKPLIVSEWNVRNQPNSSQWAASLKKVREQMARYCNAAYYFSLVKGGSMAGPAGVFSNTSWSPNDPFYSAVKSFAYMEGGSK